MSQYPQWPFKWFESTSVLVEHQNLSFDKKSLVQAVYILFSFSGTLSNLNGNTQGTLWLLILESKLVRQGSGTQTKISFFVNGYYSWRNLDMHYLINTFYNLINPIDIFGNSGIHSRTILIITTLDSSPRNYATNFIILCVTLTKLTSPLNINGIGNWAIQRSTRISLQIETL